jgi:hypothetical protein
MEVYKAIASVMGALAKEGISKDRKNAAQGYNFRGIDDVYAALSTLLAKNDLVIVPRVMSHRLEERETKNGGRMAYSFVDVEFDLVSAVDGSKHTARTTGEGMDSADKSTNKAMSAAYKYMAFMVFCIPTEGDNDADAHTPEIKSAPKPAAPPTPKNDDDAKQIEAKDFCAKGLKLTREQFAEYQTRCKEAEVSWIVGACDAKRLGVDSFVGLMRFVLEGVAPEVAA